MLYTVTTPDWEEPGSQSDLHLVSMTEGYTSSRQLTFTEDANEGSPAWGPDGSYFLFLSNRDASGSNRGSQLYLMRTDGGEARKITEARDGVSNFDFSPDGTWLVYRSGPSGQAQLYRLPVAGLTQGEPEKLTEGEAGGLRTPGASTSSVPIPSMRLTRNGGRRGSRWTSRTW